MKIRWGILLILISLAMSSLFVPEKFYARIQSTNYIKRSSSAIALTPDGAVLIAVNPDSNTITLIDTENLTVISEIPVGTDPRTVTIDNQGKRAYIANRDSNSVSVVDLDLGEEIAEVPTGIRPYGVVLSPDESRLYISEQSMDRINILDTGSLESVYLINVPDRPSGLSISPDGSTLFVTHLLNGLISAIALDTHTSFLPIVINNSSGDTWRFGHAGIAQAQNGRYQIKQISLWPDSNLVQSFVISPDGKTGYVPHTRSNTNNRALTFDTTVFPTVSQIDLTNLQHAIGKQLDLGTLDPPGVGLPFDLAITPDGKELWIVNAASNDVSVIDSISRQLISHIEVGDNPRGITISPDGSVAYVNNTLAGTVSIIDTQNYQIANTIKVTDIPLPPILLRGKQLFHSSDDPRMSKSQWIACNTCHFEGEHDGRTWFFGFAGPRNTTSLLGMIETYPLRWSGEWDESADSEFANRKENFGSGLISGEMNCSLSPPDCVAHPPNQGRSNDLDALAAFIDSLEIPPSPDHANGEPLTPAEQRGKAIFNDPSLGCINCHPAPLYTDKLVHDVGTSTPDEKIGPAYDTPSLRGLYESAPFFHNGSAADLYEALTFISPNNEHNVSGILSETELQDLIAFLNALPIEN